jgi:hypothetical protein
MEKLEGFRISIYGDDHNPPHIHVTTPQQTKVRMVIKDGTLLSGKLTKADRIELEAWLTRNQESCLHLWKLRNPNLRD